MNKVSKEIKELSPIYWDENSKTVFIIDQRLLPNEFKYVEIKSCQEMAIAIKDMLLRGAPLIGIAAAFGMALAAQAEEDLDSADSLLRSTRPTAVNLMWALDRVQMVMEDLDLKNQDNPKEYAFESILNEAKYILQDDIERCKKIGEVGAKQIKEKFKSKIAKGEKLKIMTHCNAGALATGGYGTALGVVRKLHEENLVEMVFSNETRPRQQGSRLTVWELAYEHIPVTMNADTMSAHLMKEHTLDLVIVGADRIAANGDAANKIGTYQLAISAKHHDIPFYVAAPLSTVDKSISDGSHIPIEERCSTELSHINDGPCTITSENSKLENYDLAGTDHDLAEAKFINPGFDVTPRELIEAIFTEEGLF